MTRTFTRTAAAVVLATAFLCTAPIKNLKAQNTFRERHLETTGIPTASANYAFFQARDTKNNKYNRANIYQWEIRQSYHNGPRWMRYMHVGMKATRNESRTFIAGTGDWAAKTTHSAGLGSAITFNSGKIMTVDMQFGENQTYAFRMGFGWEFSGLFRDAWLSLMVEGAATLAGQGFPMEGNVAQLEVALAKHPSVVGRTTVFAFRASLAPGSFGPEIQSGILTGAKGRPEAGFRVELPLNWRFAIGMEGGIGKNGGYAGTGINLIF